MAQPTPKQIWLKVYDIPEHELAYWGSLDRRVSCRGCSNIVGIRCTVTNIPHVPYELKHYCESFKAKK